MSDRDALVLTLVRGLEHAATALNVVNDATRREVSALLSPRARRLLAALTAAPTEAAAPLGDAAEAIEASDPQPKRQKASASKPTGKPVEVTGEWLKAQPKKRRHIAESSDDDDARPRTASGLQAFPEDVLGAIIAFVDLPMRFTCVVACGAMRDAAARLSPRLEHALVLRRYPMLATIGSSPTAAPAPRDLLRAYERIFRRRRSARPRPTTTLDDYTLTLELDVRQGHRLKDAPPQHLGYERMSELWIATGTFSGDDEPTFEFTVPSTFEDVTSRDDYSSWVVTAKVMVSRRTGGGRVQIAMLFDGGGEEYGDEVLAFDWSTIPHNRRNKALHWLNPPNFAEPDSYIWRVPQLFLTWPCRSPKLKAHFMMRDENGLGGMSLSEACMTLEHFVEWSK